MKKEILFIKLGSLGDILLATPLLEALKKKYSISYLVNKSCKVMVEEDKELEKIFIMNDLGAGKKSFSNLIILINSFFELRKKRYSKIFLLHRSKILINLCKLLKVDEIITFSDENKKHGKITLVNFDLNEHRIDRNLKMLGNEFNNKSISQDMKFFYKKKEGLLKKFDLLKKEYIVISPGGGKNRWSEMKSRRWSIKNYVELISRLNIKNKIVLIGSQDDNEIAKKMENKNVINLCGKTNIYETAQIIDEARLFIGNDSMPLFIAGSLNTPLIGLFGPTNGKVINPLNKNSKYVQAKIECSPCYNPIEGVKGLAYTCNHISCMKNKISVDVVLEKIKELELDKYDL